MNEILDAILYEIADLIEDGLDWRSAVVQSIKETELTTDEVVKAFEGEYLCTPEVYEQNNKEDEQWSDENTALLDAGFDNEEDALVDAVPLDDMDNL